MLYYTEISLSPLEVPQEMSICIYISGCVNQCVNCHYPNLQKLAYGNPLNEYFTVIIDLYFTQATCVCFLGEGRRTDEEKQEFAEYVAYAHSVGLKTCLYSGRDGKIEAWMLQFDYVKIGSYQQSNGALDVPTTNQRMYKKSKEGFIDITSLFWAER